MSRISSSASTPPVVNPTAKRLSITCQNLTHAEEVFSFLAQKYPQDEVQLEHTVHLNTRIKENDFKQVELFVKTSVPKQLTPPVVETKIQSVPSKKPPAEDVILPMQMGIVKTKETQSFFGPAVELFFSTELLAETFAEKCNESGIFICAGTSPASRLLSKNGERSYREFLAILTCVDK